MMKQITFEKDHKLVTVRLIHTDTIVVSKSLLSTQNMVTIDNDDEEWLYSVMQKFP